jgi:purine-nucleoside phosphorylase
MTTLLVSRCLLGVPCRYHGRTPRGSKPGVPHGRILALQHTGRYQIIDVCPECDAGLPVPRPPTRLLGGRLICGGQDVTAQFELGAQIALARALGSGAEKAYLVRGSPSCDSRTGVTGRLLAAAGLKVVSV